MVQIKMKLFLLAFLLISSESILAKVDAVNCNGQLYSLDYLLIKDKLPYGPLFGEKDLAPGTFMQGLIYIAIIEKSAPELSPQLRLYLETLRNETDMSRPAIWQASTLALPTETLLLKDYPALSQCAVNGKIEGLSVVQRIQQGQMTVFEYDQKLLKTLSTSNVQLSFLYMGTFLRLINDNLNSLSNINGLIHSQQTIGQPPETLSDLFIKFGMKQAAATGVCQRSSFVVEGLQISTGLPCEIIQGADLAKVTQLKIEASSDSQKKWVFKTQDLAGLPNLADLSINGFDFDFSNVPAKEFVGLTKLKKLSLTGLEMDIPPDGIRETIVGLEYLDLRNDNFYEFKENFFRKMFVQEIGKVAEVVLDLSDNNSRWQPRKRVYVHPGTFNNCQAVTKLLMKNMYITKLDGTVFSPLVSLKELDLSKNPLSDFPLPLLDLPKLQVLHICSSKEKQAEINAEIIKRGSSLQIKWCE